MIMIRLMGGLGNQMFQYAFGLALSIKHNTELVIDDSLLTDRSTDHFVYTHRNFDLDIFKNLKFRRASQKEVFLYNGSKEANFLKKILRRLSNTIQRRKLTIQLNNQVNGYVFHSTDNTCYVGRWQSYQFFKKYEEEVKVAFELNKPEISGIDELINKIVQSESVCLHVRRGDLITSPLYNKTIGVLEKAYYIKAVSYIQKNVLKPVFFVFSDDINWCKQNLKFEVDLVFVDECYAGNRSEGHFYLMQHCKHFIISNSTFAWWTAFLSKNESKKVVYPKNWYKSVELENPEMCPKDWISI